MHILFLLYQLPICVYRYRLNNQISTSSKSHDFFYRHPPPDRLCDLPGFLFDVHCWYSVTKKSYPLNPPSEVNLTGLESYHWPPCSDEVRNAWSYESTLRTPRGMVIYGSHRYLISVSALLLYPTILPSINPSIYLSIYLSTHPSLLCVPPLN
jgi:hypothetical protein